jgi:hypothetical protein
MIIEDLRSLAVSIKDLKPAERNPRIGDVEAIKKSYERFGQRKPIIAHKKTKRIIAGNHQFQAAQELGWKEVAVVWVEDDAETATAYSVADNRIGQLGEWNVEELIAAFEEIAPADLETVGFTQIDIEDFRALADEHLMTSPATSIDGGLGSRTNKGDGNPDLQVEKTNTYDEFLERYVNRATRGILLYYPQEDYAKMVEWLDTLAKRFGYDNHAETVQKIVEEAL